MSNSQNTQPSEITQLGTDVPTANSGSQDTSGLEVDGGGMEVNDIQRIIDMLEKSAAELASSGRTTSDDGLQVDHVKRLVDALHRSNAEYLQRTSGGGGSIRTQGDMRAELLGYLGINPTSSDQQRTRLGDGIDKIFERLKSAESNNSTRTGPPSLSVDSTAAAGTVEFGDPLSPQSPDGGVPLCAFGSLELSEQHDEVSSTTETSKDRTAVDETTSGKGESSEPGHRTLLSVLTMDQRGSGSGSDGSPITPAVATLRGPIDHRFQTKG